MPSNKGWKKFIVPLLKPSTPGKVLFISCQEEDSKVHSLCGKQMKIKERSEGNEKNGEEGKKIETRVYWKQ